MSTETIDPVSERMSEAFGLPPGRWVDIDGPVHFREWEGPAEPTFVCVHGLGGSHLNWMAVAPDLARHGRVLALDLAGFGHTHRDGRGSDIYSNRRLLSRFLKEMTDGPVMLVGNSMGGGIALLQAGVEPASASGLVLTDATLPLSRGGAPSPLVVAVFAAYRIPGLGERFLTGRMSRHTAQEIIDQSMKFIAADPSTIPPQVMRAHVELAESRQEIEDTIPAFLEAARSLLSLGTRPKLARKVMDRIACPVLMMHGDQDRLVPVAYARAAARRYPDWRLVVLEGLGHAPMMEAPDRWVATVEGWLAELDREG